MPPYTELDHDKMTDDGAPPPEFTQTRVSKIGLAPKTIVANDVPPPPTSGSTVAAASPEPDPEQLTWASYAAWQKTLTKPYDDNDNLARTDDIVQATLELVGEWGELIQLIAEQSINAFLDGRNRDKLIDEVGDILFCASWLMDAWGYNAFANTTRPLELLPEEDSGRGKLVGRAFREHTPLLLEDPEAYVAAMTYVTNACTNGMMLIGLAANAAKKRKYHRKPQDRDTQIARVIASLDEVAEILMAAQATPEMAVRSNMKKLNARYPGGYKPGMGGGIRTGDGAGL